jgi:hypothetical protein
MDPTYPAFGGGTDDTTVPAPPRRNRRALKVILAVLATVIVVGVPSAVALILTLSRGSGDQLVRMVPADSDVYVTALLDPSLSQKRDLQSILERFPQLKSPQDIQKTISSGLDDSLKSLGIDYTHDVQPWLGSQIAFSVGSRDFSKPQFALLMRTTDEHASLAALNKTKSSPQSHDLTWSTTSHGGVSITDGEPSSGQSSTDRTVFAVFDHTAVVTDDIAYIDQIIDADQGKTGNLGGTASYQKQMQDLPSDHILVAYVNAQPLVAALQKPLQSYLDQAPQAVRDSFASLDAYRTFGATLSLQQNGAALDTVTYTDPSKMSASAREALTSQPRDGAMLSWVPQDSFAVIASSTKGGSGLVGPAAAVIAALTVVGKQETSTFSNVSNGLDQGSSDAGSAPPPPPLPVDTTPQQSNDQVNQMLDQLGVTGSGGILSHLTGESAIFVGPGSKSLPVDAVAVLGTDDPAGMDSTLRKLGDLVLGGGDGQSVPWQTLQDGSVAIHYLDLGSGAPVLPAYAVDGDYVLIGTDPSSVRHAVDAHNGTESSITSQDHFRSATAGQPTASVTFVDLQRIAQAIESSLSGSDRDSFDQNAMPVLRPMRTFTATSGGDVHHQTAHMVLTFGG